MLQKQIFVLEEKQTLVLVESEHNGVSLECGSRGAVFPEMGNVRKKSFRQKASHCKVIHPIGLIIHLIGL